MGHCGGGGVGGGWGGWRVFFFFFNDTATTEIYTLSLHDALPISLVAGGIAASNMGTQFAGQTLFLIDFRAGDRVEGNPESSPATQAGPSFDTLRRELMDVVWRLDGQVSTGPTRPTGPTGPTRPTRQPFDWTVRAYPDRNQLQLSVVGSGVDQTRHLLGALADEYRRSVETLVEKERASAEANRQHLAERQQALQTLIDEIGQEAGEASQPLPNDDPLRQLLVGFDELRAKRQDYQDLRQRFRSLLLQRENLLHAPPPTMAVVDPETRRKAYAANVVLREDSRQLEVRLAQVRSAMLKVWKAATANFEDILGLSRGLSHALDTFGTAMAPSGSRVLLEQVAENTADYHHWAMALAQEWTRSFAELQALTINPAAPRTLAIHDRIVERTGTLLHEMSQTLTLADGRIRAMNERAAYDARQPGVAATGPRPFRQLQATHRRLDSVLAELTTRNNYALDAALRSGRGLVHRTAAIRKAIDASLEEAARQQALADRQARIDALAAQIGQLRADMADHVEIVFRAQEHLRGTAEQVPPFVESATTDKVAGGKRDLLAKQMAEIDQLLASITSPGIQRVDPVDIRIVQQSVDSHPINRFEILSFGLLAWSMAFLAILGVARAAGASHGKVS